MGTRTIQREGLTTRTFPSRRPNSSRQRRRVGRPPLGDEPRRLIPIGVDPGVLESFRMEARRRHVGYQTLINEVLAEHIRRTWP